MNQIAASHYSAIDLFSGCGGLSNGFQQSGITANFAVDNWGEALDSLETNHPDTRAIEFDLGSGSLSSLTSQLQDSDVVFGGPPCQGFSISGKRDPLDPRNLLYKGFLDVVAEIRPKIFVMENVPNLASMEQGRLLQAIERDFEDLGYTLAKQVLLASDFGVPQNRRRLFLVGSLIGESFQFPTPTHPTQDEKITCGQAMDDLPEGSVDNGAPYGIRPHSYYQEQMRQGSPGIFNHEVTKHSEKTVSTIALVPDGGNYKDLPEHLQSTRKVNIAWTRYSRYRPSLTIDTGHRHHFHYEFNRIPTVRESARLQSFSDTFIFKGSKTSQYKQVGNAVPPLLARALGQAVRDHLGGV